MRRKIVKQQLVRLHKCYAIVTITTSNISWCLSLS